MGGDRPRRTTTAGVGLIVLALGSGRADSAQAPPSPTETEQSLYELRDVFVRGRPANPVTNALIVAPSQELTLEVVTREDIEARRPRTALDAITFTPALEIRRKGRKNPVNLSLRGDGSVNVLLDGMNIAAREDYRFLHFTPASLVDVVRVVRDSSSLMYGPPQLSSPNGIVGFGGVVDVHLRDPTPEHSGEFRTEVGRYQESNQHLHLSGPLSEGLGYLLSVDRSYYDGPGGENMGHGLSNATARVCWNYAEDSTLTLTALHEDGWKEVQLAEPPSFFATPLPYVQEYDPWRTTILALRVNHLWTADSSTMVDAYYRDHESVLHEHHLGDAEADVHESKRGLHLRHTLRTPEQNTLRLGSQVAVWSNPTGKLYYGGYTPAGVLRTYPRRETDYSFYIQDELAALPDRLILDAGVRWDRKHIDKGYTSNGPALGNTQKVGTPFEDQWREPAVSYSLGTRCEITARQTVTCRLAVSREATSSDFLTDPALGGSQLPDAEEVRYELGYKLRVCPQLVLGLTAFHKDIENGISYAGRKKVAGVWTPFWEASDFSRVGGEVKAEGTIAEGLDYFGSCTCMTGDNETLGEHDDRLPRYLLAAGLRYRSGPWGAAFSAKHVGGYEDNFGMADQTTFVDVGDYWLADLNVSYTIDSDRFLHEVYAGVRNLADERYETFPGWRDPGRSLYVGYSARF